MLSIIQIYGKSILLWKDICKNFNACFFVGLCIMALVGSFWLNKFMYGRDDFYLYVIFPIISGCLTMFAVYGLRIFLLRKKYIKKQEANSLPTLMLTAFTAGVSVVYINNTVCSFLLGILIVYFTVLKVRDFAKNMAKLLPKGIEASSLDVIKFFNFFINLIVAFSAINLVLDIVESKLFGVRSFNFGDNFAAICDTLYFTVATVTTVGYGDIAPQTDLARIIVSLECLTSYIMFALMIGIISRGIKLSTPEDK